MPEEFHSRGEHPILEELGRFLEKKYIDKKPVKELFELEKQPKAKEFAEELRELAAIMKEIYEHPNLSEEEKEISANHAIWDKKAEILEKMVLPKDPEDPEFDKKVEEYLKVSVLNKLMRNGFLEYGPELYIPSVISLVEVTGMRSAENDAILKHKRELANMALTKEDILREIVSEVERARNVIRLAYFQHHMKKGNLNQAVDVTKRIDRIRIDPREIFNKHAEEHFERVRKLKLE